MHEGTAPKHIKAVLGGDERKALLSGIVGMSGVGKTRALICLGYDDDVRRRFPDGIHFVTFGLQAVASEVILRIGRFARVSGGRMRSKEAESSPYLSDAVENVAEGFSDKASLFLCGYPWRIEGHGDGFLEDFKHLLAPVRKAEW